MRYPWRSDSLQQWGIRDFSEVWCQPSGGRGANIRFCQIFPKTAWNWKNLDPRRGVPCAPLRPTTVQLDQGHLQYVALTLRCCGLGPNEYEWVGIKHDTPMPYSQFRVLCHQALFLSPVLSLRTSTFHRMTDTRTYRYYILVLMIGNIQIIACDNIVPLPNTKTVFPTISLFSKFFGGRQSFCRATDTPGLHCWWRGRLAWVSIIFILIFFWFIQGTRESIQESMSVWHMRQKIFGQTSCNFERWFELLLM